MVDAGKRATVAKLTVNDIGFEYAAFRLNALSVVCAGAVRRVAQVAVRQGSTPRTGQTRWLSCCAVKVGSRHLNNAVGTGGVKQEGVKQVRRKFTFLGVYIVFEQGNAHIRVGFARGQSKRTPSHLLLQFSVGRCIALALEAPFVFLKVAQCVAVLPHQHQHLREVVLPFRVQTALVFEVRFVVQSCGFAIVARQAVGVGQSNGGIKTGTIEFVGLAKLQCSGKVVAIVECRLSELHPLFEALGIHFLGMDEPQQCKNGNQSKVPRIHSPRM